MRELIKMRVYKPLFLGLILWAGVSGVLMAKGQLYLEAGINSIYVDGAYVGVGSQLVELEAKNYQVVVKNPSGKEIRNELVMIRDTQTTRIVIGMDADTAKEQVQQKQVDKAYETGFAGRQGNSAETLMPKNVNRAQLRLFGIFGWKGYNAAFSGGNLDCSYDLQYGTSGELSLPLASNLNVAFGGDYGFASPIKLLGITLASPAISNVHLNLESADFSNAKANIFWGGGVNYSFWNGVAVTGGLGWQAYIMASVPSGAFNFNMSFAYESYTGTTAYPSTITSAGFVLRTGYAYNI